VIETAILFLVLMLMIFMSLLISGYLVKRATEEVIGRFCSYDALEIRKARTLKDLGLVPRDFFQRLFRRRDYKPYALQSLSQAGIIRTTQEGKLYLVEERLNDKLKCKKS
jgi:hypothetical protein